MTDSVFFDHILGIKDLRVIRFEDEDGQEVRLYVESALSAAPCPNCGYVSKQIHDWDETRIIRDLPIDEKRCYLIYRARRFKCERCMQTFAERTDWKRINADHTERYEWHIYQRVLRDGLTRVTQDEDLNEGTTLAIFERKTQKRLKDVSLRLSGIVK